MFAVKKPGSLHKMLQSEAVLGLARLPKNPKRVARSWGHVERMKLPLPSVQLGSPRLVLPPFLQFAVDP